MSSDTATPNVSPTKDDVRPETYAVYVDDEFIHVFQYRVTLSERDGEWYFVETLDRDNDPRLSLESATPQPPRGDSYWIYGRSYDCTLDCE
jgi:hypothetical protein